MSLVHVSLDGHVELPSDVLIDIHTLEAFLRQWDPSIYTLHETKAGMCKWAVFKRFSQCSQCHLCYYLVNVQKSPPDLLIDIHLKPVSDFETHQYTPHMKPMLACMCEWAVLRDLISVPNVIALLWQDGRPSSQSTPSEQQSAPSSPLVTSHTLAVFVQSFPCA